MYCASKRLVAIEAINKRKLRIIQGYFKFDLNFILYSVKSVSSAEQLVSQTIMKV